jgi:2-oxoglutarate dehydrogenase E2 component (dihydrolipoamide succinyltransferase)
MSGIEDVLVPANEEGTRATILRWCKAVGDTVIKDEPLVELETDKVTVEVPAPVSGTLIEVLKPENAEVSPDEVLARVRLPGESMSPAENIASTPKPRTESPQAAGAHEPLSPSVRRLLREHSIAAGDINGTGRNGRVTAQDVTRHVSQTQVPLRPRPRSPGPNPPTRNPRTHWFRTLPFGGAWPNTWRAVSPTHRMSPHCSKRISRAYSSIAPCMREASSRAARD